MSSSRQARASNFAHTCNLLSQYIKEKGSLKDLNLEINGRVENLEALVKNGSSNPMLSSSTTTTIDGLRESSKTVNSVQDDEDASHKQHTSKDPAAAAEADSTSSPLTIFYSGRVLVFNNYPESKAKELLALAHKESSKTFCGISSNTLPPTRATPYSRPPPTPPPPPQQKPESRNPINCIIISANAAAGADPRQSVASSSRGESPIQHQIEANNSGLRIARRSSIHKFLEKRKDRAVARGPYNRVQDNQASSSKGEDHLDLKL